MRRRLLPRTARAPTPTRRLTGRAVGGGPYRVDMPTVGDRASTRLEEVLDAAFVCFTRYGYRRTAMEDIAGAAGLSRAAVYQYVRNKEDAFRALSRRIHDRALAAAVTAAGAPVPVTERLTAVLRAKLDMVLDLDRVSPHAAELISEGDRVAGEVSRDFHAALTGVLTGLVDDAAAAGELRLRPGGPDAGETARIALTMVRGLELDGDDAAALHRRLDHMVTVLVRGLAPAAGDPAGR